MNEETKFYQNIVGDSPSAVVIVEKKSKKILFANAAWQKLMNIPTEEKLVGKTLTEYIPKEAMLLTEEEVANLPEDHYQEVRRKTIKGRFLRLQAKTIFWNGIEAYIDYISDETVIQNSRNQLQILLNRIPAGVGIFQVENGVPSLVYINDAYFDMIGANREKRVRYMGNQITHVVVEEDYGVIEQVVRDIQRDKDLIDVHFRIISGDGSKRWIRMAGSVVARSAGNVTMYACFSDFQQVMENQLELSSSRKMLDAALNNVKALVWRYDPYTNIIVDSASLGEEYGLPKVIDNIPERLILGQFVAPDSVDDFRAMFQKMPCNQMIYQDVKVKSADGSNYVWVRLIYTPVFDEEGKIIEEIGSSIDITEQKIIEQRYQYELQVKEDLVNDALLYYQLNLSKMEIEENRFFQGDVIKYEKPARITATNWMRQLKSYIAPQDQRVITKTFNVTHMLDAYEKGTGELKAPFLHMSETITDRWCSAQVSLMKRPESGDVIAMFYVKDVDDEHKQDMALSSIIEEEIEFVSLLNTETKQARLLKFSPDCTLLPQGKVYDFNEFGQQLIASHLQPEERQECIEYFDCDKLVKRLEKAADSSYIFSCLLDDEKVHRKKTRAYYLDGSRKDIVIVRRDITELFEKEQAKAAELTEALNRAQEASKSKSAFLSRVSHDMRTPLNGILGLTRLMKDKTDWSEIQSDLEQLELSGDYLLNLINDTLDVSKIENTQLELHPTICDGKTVFSNTMRLLRPNIDAKNIEFVINAKDLPFTMLYIDAGRLEQLVMNILSNAIKFTPTGGRIEFSMENIEETETELVDKVSIKDNGIGMSQEFLPHLFEPFSQEETGRTSKYQGTGLGMTISKQIVELMGGEIQVYSEPNKGTEFTFTIHLAKATPQQVKQWKQGHKTEVDVKVVHGKRVLLCEDHPLNTQIAIRLLEKEEMIVEHACNGAEGVEMYEKAPEHYYDLILMDIRMPVMDGLDATKKIRISDKADSKSIPIIAMTANALSDDIEATQKAGMNAHLSKPIEPELLYETMAMFLMDK